MADKIYNIPLYANVEGTPIIVLDPQSIPTDNASQAKSKNFINSGTAKAQHNQIINDLKSYLDKQIASLKSSLTSSISNKVGIPNYKKVVRYGNYGYSVNSAKTVKFTCKMNGWLYVNALCDDTWMRYYINGIQVARIRK